MRVVGGLVPLLAMVHVGCKGISLYAGNGQCGLYEAYALHHTIGSIQRETIYTQPYSLNLNTGSKANL